MPSLTITIEDTSPLISYSSGWSAGTSINDNRADQYSQSSFYVTRTFGALASFTFNGSGIQIFGAKRGNHGSYSVRVDDKVYPPFNGNALDPGQFQVSLFSETSLDQGLHQIIITNQDNAYLDIDYITWQTKIGTDSDKLAVNIFQDTDSSFAYSSSETAWSTSPMNIGTFLGSSGHVATNPEASFLFTFEGRVVSHLYIFPNGLRSWKSGEAVSLYGPVGPGSSSFSVSVDGGSAQNYKWNDGPYVPQMMLYHINFLGSGLHQLKLVSHEQSLAIDYAAVYSTSTSTSTSIIPDTTEPVSPATHSGSVTSPQTNKLTLGALIGMGIAVTLFLAVLGFVVFYFRRSKSKKRGGERNGRHPEIVPYVPQEIANNVYFSPSLSPSRSQLMLSKPRLHTSRTQGSGFSPANYYEDSESPGFQYTRINQSQSPASSGYTRPLIGSPSSIPGDEVPRSNRAFIGDGNARGPDGPPPDYLQ